MTRGPGFGDTDLRWARDVMDMALRPGELGNLDAWRRAVLDEVKRFTGADRGGFLVDRGGAHDWVSDYPEPMVDQYGERVEDLAPGVDFWERQIGLGVHSRDEVWLPLRPDFYETAYYQDYLRRLRAFDALGLTWRLGDGGGSGTVCQFLLHHESEKGARFGPRERALLELLAPALRAGSDHALFLQERVDSVVDHLTVPAALLDPRGTVLHLNRPARALLDEHPPLVRGLRSLVAGGERDPLSAIPRGTAASRIEAGGMTVDVSMSRFPLGGARGTGLLVTMRPRSRGGASSRSMERARSLGLTRRQAQVALLLARGLSNKGIARELGVRPKTARRHTEDILRRLGISRRGEVAPLLLDQQ